MIGNDIVDLKTAALQSNWKRSGFLDKVFTKEEQQFILNSEDESQMVWLLWSIKEAAYKIYVQKYGVRFFNPKILRCDLASKNDGLVCIDGNKYVTKSEITDDFINTLAYSEKTRSSINYNFKIENTSYKIRSNLTRQRLLLSFSKLKNTPVNELRILKNEIGVPKLFYNNEEQNDSFSITHHGFYSAYAISV
tara:strand:+ start:5498 stop:6076 length:579 start_codon:yes stop_codon:yes gene_type:complete